MLNNIKNHKEQSRLFFSFIIIYYRRKMKEAWPGQADLFGVCYRGDEADLGWHDTATKVVDREDDLVHQSYSVFAWCLHPGTMTLFALFFVMLYRPTVFANMASRVVDGWRFPCYLLLFFLTICHGLFLFLFHSDHYLPLYVFYTRPAYFDPRGATFASLIVVVLYLFCRQSSRQTVTEDGHTRLRLCFHLLQMLFCAYQNMWVGGTYCLQIDMVLISLDMLLTSYAKNLLSIFYGISLSMLHRFFGKERPFSVNMPSLSEIVQGLAIFRHLYVLTVCVIMLCTPTLILGIHRNLSPPRIYADVQGALFFIGFLSLSHLLVSAKERAMVWWQDYNIEVEYPDDDDEEV
jgi:hypothetical protein